MASLTEARRRYESDGYVVFRDVLDAALIAEADQHVDWLLARNPTLGAEELGHRLARDDPFWLRFVADDRLLDIAHAFVGPGIALFATHYLCKPPRTGRPVLWHQDGAFWPLDPMEVITLWVSITHSDAGNGCLRVIPGTHTQVLAGMTERTDVDSVLGRETDYEVDESQAVDLELRPGDVSVHHPNILHSSDANGSDRWRRALTIRYIPTSTRITEADAATAFLLRGRAVDGVNDYRPRPCFRDGVHMPFAGDDDWR